MCRQAGAVAVPRDSLKQGLEPGARDPPAPLTPHPGREVVKRAAGDSSGRAGATLLEQNEGSRGLDHALQMGLQPGVVRLAPGAFPAFMSVPEFPLVKGLDPLGDQCDSALEGRSRYQLERRARAQGAFHVVVKLIDHVVENRLELQRGLIAPGGEVKEKDFEVLTEKIARFHFFHEIPLSGVPMTGNDVI